MARIIILNKPFYCAYSRCDKINEKIEGLASKVVAENIYTPRKLGLIVEDDCDFCYAWEQPNFGKNLKFEDVFIKYEP